MDMQMPGTDGWLTKPVHVADIKNALERWLKARPAARSSTDALR
jgi:hypothetical protein